MELGGSYNFRQLFHVDGFDIHDVCNAIVVSIKKTKTIDHECVLKL
jgi:hypothetical protein